MKTKLCPSCVGSTQVMIPKTNGSKGFEYIDCSLCNGTGVVSKELEEGFILSLNEDSLETNDDW
jgi:DnaJ-class molecular chaperone